MKNLKAYVTKNKSKYVETKLKEYDNFKKLITNFIKKKYKYISYVHGGFEKIHEESLKFKIPLLNHDDNCYLCKKKIKRKNDSFSNGILKKKSVQNFFNFGKNSKKIENSPNKKSEKSDKNEKKNNEINNKNKDNNNNNNNNENKDIKKGFFSNLFSRKKSDNSKIDKIDPKKVENNLSPINKYKFNEEKCKFEIELDNDNDNNNNNININKFELDKSELNIKSKYINLKL
jgi:hypothetical protein